jgi:hypothetical protein
MGSPTTQRDPGTQRRNEWLVIAVFAAVSLVLLLHHEPWGDEARPWIIARERAGPWDLIQNICYEGTPALWYLLLQPLAKAGAPYVSMALLHWVLALAAVTLFVRYAPFSFTHKALFPFGYYMLFEYNVLARSYVLVVLLMFLAALLYRRRFERPVFHGALILLLANANMHGLLIAIVLGGAFVLELVWLRKHKLSAGHVVSLLLIGFGYFAALYQAWPPPDLPRHFQAWHLDLSVPALRRLARVGIAAFLPVPAPTPRFWGSKALLAYGTPELAFLGVPLILASFLFFLRKRVVLLIYAASIGGLLAFFAMFYIGSTRHHGLVYVVFVFCLWISSQYKGKTPFRNGFLVRLTQPKTLRGLLTAVLVTHAAASVVPVYYDLRYEFSTGESVATFLEKNDFLNEETLVATYPSGLAVCILPYLPEPYSRRYALETGSYEGLITWTRHNRPLGMFSADELIARMDRAIAKRPWKEVMLIVSDEVKRREPLNKRYELIARFGPAIVEGQTYFIYRLRESKGPRRSEQHP